jgi:hypothetical protein
MDVLRLKIAGVCRSRMSAIADRVLLAKTPASRSGDAGETCAHGSA